jgi:hypothetical protein
LLDPRRRTVAKPCGNGFVLRADGFTRAGVPESGGGFVGKKNAQARAHVECDPN